MQWVGKSLTTQLFSPSDSEHCKRNSVCVLGTCSGLSLVFGHLGMNTDTCALVNEGVPWMTPLAVCVCVRARVW